MEESKAPADPVEERDVLKLIAMLDDERVLAKVCSRIRVVHDRISLSGAVSQRVQVDIGYLTHEPKKEEL